MKKKSQFNNLQVNLTKLKKNIILFLFPSINGKKSNVKLYIKKSAKNLTFKIEKKYYSRSRQCCQLGMNVTTKSIQINAHVKLLTHACIQR